MEYLAFLVFILEALFKFANLSRVSPTEISRFFISSSGMMTKTRSSYSSILAR